MEDTRIDGKHQSGDEDFPIAISAKSETGDPVTQSSIVNLRGPISSLKTLIWLRSLKETVVGCWDFIKSSDFTNPVISIATIVIAVATWLTYREVHGGSTQTDKIIAADERIAKAMEDSVGQAQKRFAATTRQAEIAQRAWV
jgi:hypothetical protein